MAMLNDQTETDDIVILTISGRIEKADMDRIMRRLDAALARNSKVHIFAEVLGFEGMPADAWWSDIGHAVHYLGRLKQFGRIAIVSDQSWIRAASRIESALLPFVAYKVYTPDQRDHALAWVKGETGAARPETMRFLADEEPGIIAFEIDGRLTREAVDALHAHLSPLARPGAQLRILALVRHFAGFDPAILADRHYLELKFSLLRHVARYAFVGGPEWMEAIARIADPLLHMELRHFATGDEQAARAWLQSDLAA